MCMYMFVSVDRLTTTHTHGQHNTPQQPQKHSPPPLPRPAALPARALEPVRQRVQRHGLLGGHRALPGAGYPQVRLVFGCGGAWIYLFRIHIERPVLNTVPFIYTPPQNNTAPWQSTRSTFSPWAASVATSRLSAPATPRWVFVGSVCWLVDPLSNTAYSRVYARTHRHGHTPHNPITNTNTQPQPQKTKRCAPRAWRRWRTTTA